jgi:hypothetical protein
MPRIHTTLALVAFLLPACTGGNAQLAAPPINVAEGLKELGDLYKYRASQKLPTPTRFEDLAESEASLGNAWAAIQEGKIVVVWRTGYSANSTEVLAYDKDASTNGGKVLLRNGVVKEMTADEFRAVKR